MACVVMAHIGMACVVIAHIVMACNGLRDSKGARLATKHTVMAYIVMAYRVMAPGNKTNRCPLLMPGGVRICLGHRDTVLSSYFATQHHHSRSHLAITHVYTHACTHACMHACMHAIHMPVYMPVHMPIHMPVRMPV